jgi:quercetin dioxygenase-like cupin family protein
MNPGTDNIQAAEVSLPTQDLAADLAFYTRELGFRLDMIFPADDPSVAVLSGHGLRLRLERGAPDPIPRGAAVAPGVLRLLCLDPDAFAGGRRELTAPNGVRIQIVDALPRLETPPTQHAFVVRRLKDNSPWVIGRAGMHYRDLIPGRLGGSIIASHIRIPDAGPVPDMVHYHTVGFQLIFCYHGWVRLVYEDQGPPFDLKAGDCVIQPPQIRHRVLEASENLQVVEIGVPAEHITTVDHELELPTPFLRPDRVFGGQTFCRSEVEEAVWAPWRLPGFEARETGIGAATAGVASVQVARPVNGGHGQVTSHTSDILFTFVLSGSTALHGEGQGAHALSEGDAYVIPPHLKTALTDCSDDLQLLEVSLPADFATRVHPGEHLYELERELDNR